MSQNPDLLNIYFYMFGQEAIHVCGARAVELSATSHLTTDTWISNFPLTIASDCLIAFPSAKMPAGQGLDSNEKLFAALGPFYEVGSSARPILGREIVHGVFRDQG